MMKNLAVELERIGINADLVDLNILYEYMAAYRQQHSRRIGMLQAAKRVYK